MSRFSRPTSADLAGKGRVGTLGMLIIDHYEVRDNNDEPVPLDEETIGGGGIYAMTAARLFLPPSHCSMLVDKGNDFPPRFAESLQELGEEMVWFRPRDGKTTRALNIYSGRRIGEGHQSFRYLSPQLQISPRDLVLPPSPFSPPPEWLHVVCNTARAKAIVDEAEELRRTNGWKYSLVWEPMPSSCVPAELPTIITLASAVAVISPNLLELQSILAISPRSPPTPADAEEAADKFMRSITHTDTALILRCGELGSYTLSKSWIGWVPAFWGNDCQHRVVDVTGGGNAFLGGVCAGLLITDGDMRAASVFGSVAASFAIEQRGLPNLERNSTGESWNGVDVYERLQEMDRRTQGYSRDEVA